MFLPPPPTTGRAVIPYTEGVSEVVIATVIIGEHPALHPGAPSCSGLAAGCCRREGTASPSPAAATGPPRPTRPSAGELRSWRCAAAVSWVKTTGARLQDSSRGISAHACTERAVFTLVLHLVQASDQDCNCKRCNGRLQSAGLRPLAAPAARGIPSLWVSRGEAGPPGRAGCCCRGTSRAGRAACLPPDRPCSRQGAAAPGTCQRTLKIRKLTAGISSEQARREATARSEHRPGNSAVLLVPRSHAF